jgi:hypothetical protein
LGAYLVAWGERWTREHTPDAPENARVVVQHYIDRTNEAARQLLENLGYALVHGVYVMETVLDEAPPRPHWHAGISVRAFVSGEDERPVFEAVEDAFRDMWGRPRGTFERFVGMTETESFDPSLWFLGLDGDEIAGVTLARRSPARGGSTSSGYGARGESAGSPSFATPPPSTIGAASARLVSAQTPRASPAPSGSTGGPACASWKASSYTSKSSVRV